MFLFACFNSSFLHRCTDNVVRMKSTENIPTYLLFIRSCELLSYWAITDADELINKISCNSNNNAVLRMEENIDISENGIKLVPLHCDGYCVRTWKFPLGHLDQMIYTSVENVTLFWICQVAFNWALSIKPRSIFEFTLSRTHAELLHTRGAANETTRRFKYAWRCAAL